MKDEKQSKTTDPQDGFDFIDYPIEYLFKAMVKVEPAATEGNEGKSDTSHVTESMLSLVLEHVSSEAIIRTKSNRSRTGKFESVSLTIRLESRTQLEAVYGALSTAPQVVMTL